MSGRLEVIAGCVLSGKTEELIRRLERVNIAGGSFLLFKPIINHRYSEEAIVTHYGRSLEANQLKPERESLKVLNFKGIEGASVIAFDEGNFFSDKLVELCKCLVRQGKRVIVAGQDLTFAAEPFGPMPYLMAVADKVDKLQAVCVKCGKSATRTQRLIDNKPALANSPIIVVGGEELYEARCLDCYEKPS